MIVSTLKSESEAMCELDYKLEDCPTHTTTDSSWVTKLNAMMAPKSKEVHSQRAEKGSHPSKMVRETSPQL